MEGGVYGGYGELLPFTHCCIVVAVGVAIVGLIVELIGRRSEG